MKLNKTQQEIMNKLARSRNGHAYVSWEEKRLAYSLSTDVVKVIGGRVRDAAQALLDAGLLRIKEDHSDHCWVAPNAKYACTKRWMLLEAA